MLRIITRDTPDPEGRPVDIHTGKALYVLWFHANESISESAIIEMCLNCMTALKNSRNKRAREADQSFYECRIANPIYPGEAPDLIGLGLRDGPGAEVGREVWRQIPDSWNFFDGEYANLYDLEIRPVGRYHRGKAILYSDYLDSQPEITAVEWRSAIIRQTVPSGRTGSPFPKLRSVAPPRQGLSTFNETELDLLNFMMGITHHGTYSSLRAGLRKQFGLIVDEFDDDSGRRGYVSVDWVFADLGCDVRFYVNRNLHPQLKYVVLAHELGHYLTQFAFMLTAQLVEQQSWYVPSWERVHRYLVDQEIPDKGVLERQANRIATYLLIPGRYDEGFPAIIRSTTKEKGYSETLTPADHIWEMMQEAFPETRDNYDYRSWKEVADGLERRSRELESAEKSYVDDSNLYETMLAAALTRNTERAKEESKDAFSRMINVMDRLAKLGFNSSFPRDRRQATSPFAQADASRDDRLIIDPLRPGPEPAMRFPLTVAGTTRYRAALDPSSGTRTLASWREYFPNLAMVIYKRKPIPSEPVDFDPLRIRLGVRSR